MKALRSGPLSGPIMLLLTIAAASCVLATSALALTEVQLIGRFGPEVNRTTGHGAS